VRQALSPSANPVNRKKQNQVRCFMQLANAEVITNNYPYAISAARFEGVYFPRLLLPCTWHIRCHLFSKLVSDECRLCLNLKVNNLPSILLRRFHLRHPVNTSNKAVKFIHFTVPHVTSEMISTYREPTLSSRSTSPLGPKCSLWTDGPLQSQTKAFEIGKWQNHTLRLKT